jgi:hypothetical protein
VHRADNLLPSYADCLEIWGLNLLEPSGPVKACNGIALLLPLPLRLSWDCFTFTFTPVMGLLYLYLYTCNGIALPLLFIYQPLFKAYKNAQRGIVTRSHNRCCSGKLKISSLCIVEVNM